MRLFPGALVVGSEGHVGALYAGGAKDHFDVIDIHAYGDTNRRRVHTAAFLVHFPEELRGKEVRFYGECLSTCDGRPYYADTWGPKLTVR